jgi:TolB protein
MKQKRQQFIFTLALVLAFTAVSCAPASSVDAAAAEPAEAAADQSAAEQPSAEPTAAPEPIPCNVVFETDRDGDWEIYIMGPDGENPTNLSNNPANDWEPAISPDGSQVAFVSDRDNETGGGQMIYVMNVDGSDVRQLTYQEFSSSPAWSHDGKLIAYNTDQIYVTKADGSGEPIQLTENDQINWYPVWSPDDSQIAWLSGWEGAFDIFVMNADGSNARQITDMQSANTVKWTVDGRLFTDSWGWSDQEEFCHNCVVDASGENIEDAGGKGEVQRFVPFWNGNGDRVEIIEGSLDDGPSEIYLVGEVFPDIFYNMTDNPAEDRNPSWPANCGPEFVGSASVAEDEEAPQVEEAAPQEQAAQPKEASDLVFGYAGEPSAVKLADLQQACEELGVTCVQGGSIDELVEQGVDAIIAFSSSWSVMGDWPQINAATSAGFPLYILDAETGEWGAYNLALESDWVHASMGWMAEQMGDAGEMITFNFGSNLIVEFMQSEMAEHPNITFTEIPVNFEDMSASSQESIAALVAEKPQLGAIWSSDPQGNIFWGLNELDATGEHYPAIMCLAREDEMLSWKNRMDEHPAFQCITTIKPGGNAYEAVYVAYYRLNGYEFAPSALGGEFGNTLLYDDATITNGNLDEWLGKIGELRMNEWGGLEIPPMTPEEILEKWFSK